MRRLIRFQNSLIDFKFFFVDSRRLVGVIFFFVSLPVPTFVMLPLNTVLNGGSLNNPSQLTANLQTVKNSAHIDGCEPIFVCFDRSSESFLAHPKKLH
jgi:hypothetical protein